MRKALALPTIGMVAGFLIGLALGYFFGIDFAIIGSNLASEFFTSLGILFATAFGVILLLLLGFLFIKAWYFMVPFIIGLLIGILLGLFLNSAFYEGITASFIIVIDGKALGICDAFSKKITAPRANYLGM